MTPRHCAAVPTFPEAIKALAASASSPGPCAGTGRHPHVLEPYVAVPVARHSRLPVGLSLGHPGSVGGDIDDGKGALAAISIGRAEHGEDVGEACRVRGPELVPVDHPLVAVTPGRRCDETALRAVKVLHVRAAPTVSDRGRAHVPSVARQEPRCVQRHKLGVLARGHDGRHRPHRATRSGGQAGISAVPSLPGRGLR